MLGTDIHGKPYTGMIDTFTRVLQEGKDRIIKEHSNVKGMVGDSSVSVAKMKPPILGAYNIFFSGVGPRVTWISIGGFVFFGAYEQAKQLLLHWQI